MVRRALSSSMRAILATLIPVVAFLLAAPASAVAFRPATSFERSWMKRSIETWMRPYGGFSGCRLIEQRVSTVEREWASAWVGGHCGHESDDIHGDLVIFHHNGQDRPGVWRVKGVYNDPSVCGQVPTRALVDLGAISKDYAPTCESEYEHRAQHQSEQRPSDSDIPELVNLQSVRGQAKPYQIRQLMRLVERYDLRLENR